MKKLINPFLIIGIAVILRLLPHPPNIAPITGMALFGGAYLNKRYALFVPLIAMLISDYYLGFHSTMPFVYASFLIIGAFGIYIRNHKSVPTILIACMSSSILFFALTNFGVWLVGKLYPKTFSGFLDCYFFALPFFRNTVIGDLFYTGLFFGGYEIILRMVNSKQKTLHTQQID